MLQGGLAALLPLIRATRPAPRAVLNPVVAVRLAGLRADPASTGRIVAKGPALVPVVALCAAVGEQAMAAEIAHAHAGG